MPGPKYTPDQRVEVFAFEPPGVPAGWTPGTVTYVLPMDNGGWAVEVALDNGRPRIRYALGEYGESRSVRAL